MVEITYSTGIYYHTIHNPMEGATVVVKGTKNGTTTDANGNFSLNAEPNSILVISFIGFESSEKTVSGSNEILVTLKPDVALLAEVVVGGVCVRRWTPGAIWWRIKSIFRKSH